MIGLEMRSMASAIVKPRTMQQPAFEVSNSQWPICTQNRPFLVEDATGRFGRLSGINRQFISPKLAYNPSIPDGGSKS